ncbi:hypothetical protein I5589_12165, partial [Burkholderia vietnamiensis]|nr:hypothetical protein [Burkholderia vietnamiensis]
ALEPRGAQRPAEPAPVVAPQPWGEPSVARPAAPAAPVAPAAAADAAAAARSSGSVAFDARPPAED